MYKSISPTDFLDSIDRKWEFRIHRAPVMIKPPPNSITYLGQPLEYSSLDGLQFSAAQNFIRTLMNQHTPYNRVLLNWQTGTGKTIGALGIATAFRNQPIFILGFNKSVFQHEILRHPEFGIVSHAGSARIA